MKSYYVAKLDTSCMYLKFIEYMLKKSSAFSLVYFRYNSSEKLKKTTRTLKNNLAPYKLFEKNVLAWPSMITLNRGGHIYRLAMYKATNEVGGILSAVNSLWDWDYPALPMDLCFYRNGYAWFAASSHERWNSLYVNDEEIIKEMREEGFELVDETEVSDDSVFYELYLK